MWCVNRTGLLPSIGHLASSLKISVHFGARYIGSSDMILLGSLQIQEYRVAFVMT